MLARIYPLMAVVALTLGLCGAEVCHVSGGGGLSLNTTEDILLSDSSSIQCPGANDTVEHTACCYDDVEVEDIDEDDEVVTEYEDGATTVSPVTEATKPLRRRVPRCCLPKPVQPNFIDWLIGLDDRVCRVAMVIALTVTATLLLMTVLIIVCCFWARCPLYYTCRRSYDKDDIVASARDEETANLTDMPAEDKDAKSFAPNEVKVTTLNEEEQQPLVEKKEGDEKKGDKKKEDKKKQKEEEKKKKEEEKKAKEEEKKKKEEEKREKADKKEKENQKTVNEVREVKEEKEEPKKEEKKEEKNDVKHEEKPAEEKKEESATKKEEPVAAPETNEAPKEEK